MTYGETIRRLAEITDEGLFERLATAVLRESDPDYRLIVHTGINSAGKTVKSPLDGIVFVPGANPPHMIAVHHTISERDSLSDKWLHDPATVTPRSGRPTAPAGDLIKTARIFEEQKQKMPGLRATLILATNREPSEKLIRDLHAAAASAGIAVKPVSASALAHYLDTEPNGQWIRKAYLGIAQKRLSAELLSALSQENTNIHRPPDDNSLWINRALDSTLSALGNQPIAFVVGEAGTGKSIACYKRLVEHIRKGASGLVLSHEVIAQSLSLDQAIDLSIRPLHPTLSPDSGVIARTLATEHAPLLLVIEDINKSLQPSSLVEKLIRWATDASSLKACRILCPIWPRHLATLSDEVRKRVDDRTILVTTFSANEGTNAAMHRQKVSKLEAQAISEALGHDPLLIALHHVAEKPQPELIIGRFINGSLGRLAASDPSSFTAGEYRNSLNRLAKTMLRQRHLSPSMFDIAGWFGAEPTTTMLRHIARFGEVMRISGAASHEQLDFRHDRVRDHLLAEAVADMMRSGVLPDDVLTEPFFAEIIGTALTRDAVPDEYIDRVRQSNPLALFYALRAFGPIATPFHQSLLQATENCLQKMAGFEDNGYLHWEALRILSGIEGPYVDALAQRFKGKTDTFALRARFRNGSITAGITLCFQTEPGVRFVGHLELIQFVQQRYPDRIIHELDTLLCGNTLTESGRIGALRLAGHVGDAKLETAIASSWAADTTRVDHLEDYLWASAQCVGGDAAKVLGQICDAWAALPDETEEHKTSPRFSIAEDRIRWAFHEHLAERSLKYLVQRAGDAALRAPLTYLLHGVDHPDAVEFVARRLAAMEAEIEGTDSIWPFVMSAPDEWSRRQERSGKAMSPSSKDRLHRLWAPVTNDKHLRRQAFRLWSSTQAEGDSPLLQAIDTSDLLADLALRERIKRADHTAMGAFLDKLDHDDGGYWWQFCRYMWSAELTEALDRALTRRGARFERRWDAKRESSADWITSELTMHLPRQQGEAMLFKHWDHLQFSPRFVQAALFVATPALFKAVANVVAICPDPKNLFKHTTMHFGYRKAGHQGVSRIEQIEGLLPYLHHLEDGDTIHLWDICNDNGWFDFRRNHFDGIVDRKRARYIGDERVRLELDDMVKNNRVYWADHWVDQLAKTGWTTDQIMRVLEDWLAAQNSFTALQLAARVVAYAGLRSHISLLKRHAIEPMEKASSLIDDAEFAVKLRSLQ